jgi:carbon monoxide dehydrogenase subunit G
MSEISTFESRTGRLSCSAGQAFGFLSDLRNLKRFIPANMVSKLVMEADSCSFHVDMLGMVKIHVSEKMRPVRIVYSGIVPQVKDFALSADIMEKPAGSSEIRLIIKAEINPFLRMMAAEPVRKALEKIIEEMEKFRDWEATA